MTTPQTDTTTGAGRHLSNMAGLFADADRAEHQAAPSPTPPVGVVVPAPSPTLARTPVAPSPTPVPAPAAARGVPLKSSVSALFERPAEAEVASAPVVPAPSPTPVAPSPTPQRAAPLEPEVSDALKDGPLTIAAICAVTGRSEKKVRGTLDIMEQAGKVHQIPALGKAATKWALGPAPKPEPKPQPKPPELQYRSSLDETWTTETMLVQLARNQAAFNPPQIQEGMTDPRWPRLPLDTRHYQADGDDAVTKMLIADGVKLLRVDVATGDSYVATPTPVGHRLALRYQRVSRNVDHYVEQNVRLSNEIWSPTTVNDEGDEVPKSPQQVARERSISAKGVILDGVASRNGIRAEFLDVDHMLHKGCWERRMIEAAFSSDCDQWIHTYGDAGYQKIYDYIAHLANLDRVSPALLIAGPKSSGKSMLAHAAALLFRRHGGPCSAEEAASNFNADLAESPIVFADEQLPTAWNGVLMSPALYKALVAEAFRDINQKNQPKVKQLGFTRWIIAANDLNLFPNVDFITRQSADAVCDRILLVEPPLSADGETSAPAKFLIERGGWELTERWLDDGTGAPGELVKHLAWIIENHTIQCPDPRWGIAPDAGRLGDILLASARVPKLTIGAVVSFLTGDASKARLKNAIRAGNGRVLVQLDELHRQWTAIIGTAAASGHGLDARRAAPPAGDFARAVSEALCSPHGFKVPGDARTWNELRQDPIFVEAGVRGLDLDAIRAAINKTPSAEVDRGAAA